MDIREAAIWGSTFLQMAGKLIVLFAVISFAVGLLQEYLNLKKLQSRLQQQQGLTGHLIGALLGALTPFCSCSTIPIMVGFIRSGVPFGIAMAFFWASPLLNPLILSLMFVLFGLQLTILYALLLLPLSIAFGACFEALGFASEVRIAPPSCCGCGNDSDSGPETPDHRTRLGRAAASAGSLLGRVLPFLLIGTLIGTLIHEFIPEDLIVAAAGPGRPGAVPLAALIGIPMYIRGATILPIGSALAQQGMSLGAVMALIIGGTGASLPELAILSSVFSRKLLFTYIVGILTLASVVGFVFNLLAAHGF